MTPPHPTPLGLSTARLATRGAWGEPRDAGEPVRILRRAAELGVRYIEVAGPPDRIAAGDLVRMALHPYPPDLILAVPAGAADADVVAAAHRLGVDPSHLVRSRPAGLTVLTPASLSEFERDYAATTITPPSAGLR